MSVPVGGLAVTAVTGSAAREAVTRLMRRGRPGGRQLRRLLASPLATRPLVLVSGFGWSGSSAVADVMLEHERIQRPPGGEVKFLAALALLLANAAEPPADVEAFVRGHIVDGGRYDSRMRRRKLGELFDDPGTDTDGFTDAAGQLVDRLRAGGLGALERGRHLDPELAREVVTDYLLLLHASHQTPSHLSIYDNMIPAYRLGLLRHLDVERLPDLRVFVVDRDPRDQFFELVAERRGRPDEVDTFVGDFRARRDAYRRAREQVGAGWDELVRHVQFEELVAEGSELPAGIRDEVERVVAASLGTGAWRLGTRFEVARSRANVGRWRRADDPAPYRRIGEELAPWCVQG